MQTGSTRTGSSEWYSRRRKTDISFLISGMMNLYEHQSTFNPNMPVRGLIYLCRLYEKYIVKNEIDIYTSSLKELPFPQYFVFYNGTEKEPDRQELTSGTDFDQSVANAVDICINGNILKDILTDQKAEVIQMILETYDKELHDKTLRHEGYEDGYNKGSADGYSKGSTDGYDTGFYDGIDTGILQLISTLQELNLSREETFAKIQEKYDLSPEDTESYMLKYWKE